MVLTRTDIDKVRRAVKSEVDRVFSAEFKSQVVDTIMLKIEEKFEGRFKKIEDELTGMKNQLSQVLKDNRRLRSRLDAQEQHSRRRNIRIFGMQHEADENLTEKVNKLFQAKPKLNNISKDDIESCYRVPAKNARPDRPPAVLVKFANVNTRASVLKFRKELRSSKVFIKEDLTSDWPGLLSAAINKFTQKNAWCLNGNIYVRSGDVTHRIEDIDSLDRI